MPFEYVDTSLHFFQGGSMTDYLKTLALFDFSFLGIPILYMLTSL